MGTEVCYHSSSSKYIYAQINRPLFILEQYHASVSLPTSTFDLKKPLLVQSFGVPSL